jgi:regulator of sigma E protease
MVEGVVTYLLTSAVPFVLVLSLVVFVHEFGHFQVGRWCKIAIDTFSIGFGKTLLSWRDKQGVEWRVGALPLGGYVKFKDDADAMSTGPASRYETPAALAKARAEGLFHAQPVSSRALTTAAGPLTNFVFSTIVFALLALFLGKDVTPVAQLSPRIDAVRADGPAAKAGIQNGDIVRAIDGHAVNSFGAMQDTVRAAPGKTLTFDVERAGQRLTLPVVVGERTDIDRTGVETPTGFLSVERRTLPEERQLEKYGPIEAIGVGAAQVWDIIASTGAYIGNVFSGRASAEHIAGPAGIFDTSGKVARNAFVGEASFGEKIAGLALSLLAFAATLSVAVGIVNLLPVPILDGGHLLFYAIEAIRGRPLSPKAQEIGFQAGFAMIISLFVFATWNDLQRFKLLEFVGRILS